MFSFFRKSTSPKISDFSALGADMHSHLLPGIDDGAQSLEDSLNMIRGLHSLGYRHLITTPHIYWEYYRNTPEIIRAGLEQVRAALRQEKLEVTLDAAAEYYVDEHFAKMLREEVELLPLPGQHLLIEQSFFAPYPQMQKILFTLRTRNYNPILAHPERYTYYSRDFSQLERLRDFGCLFQCNLPAFGGAYGRPVKDLAFKLLKAGMVDFIGTDLHNMRHVQQLQKMLENGDLSRVMDNYSFKNVEFSK